MAVGPAMRPAQAPSAGLANAGYARPSAARPTCPTNRSPLSEGARGSGAKRPGRKAACGRFAPTAALLSAAFDRSAARQVPCRSAA
jgi:hypothetical protein